MAIPRPWDYVQFKVERDIHSYLHVTPQDVKRIVIVGANIGSEVEELERNYKNASFILFEPSPKYYPEMLRRHGTKSHVTCIPKACGVQRGKTQFYELPMHGNGSFLRPSSSWKDFNKQNDDTVTVCEVDVTTLDEEAAEVGPIDLLWVDVQGAEMHVLKGGPKALINTKAVFLEVALCDSPYEQGANFNQLNALLHDSGHVLTLLGIDPWNYTGNALWIRRPDSLALK